MCPLSHTHTPVLAALLSAECQIGAVCPLNILISSSGKVIDSSDSWAPFTLQTCGQPHTHAGTPHTHTVHTHSCLTAAER